MKKTYMKPSVGIKKIEPLRLLAGSGLSMDRISFPKEEIINDDAVPGNEVVFD